MKSYQTSNIKWVQRWELFCMCKISLSEGPREYSRRVCDSPLGGSPRVIFYASYFEVSASLRSFQAKLLKATGSMYVQCTVTA